MILIWRGWGILVPIMVVVACAATDLLGRKNSRLDILSIYLAASALCVVAHFLVGAYRKSTAKERIFRNETTGKEVKKRVIVETDAKTGEAREVIVKDDFFFIPIGFWSFIFMLLGIYLYCSRT